MKSIINHLETVSTIGMDVGGFGKDARSKEALPLVED